MVAIIACQPSRNGKRQLAGTLMRINSGHTDTRAMTLTVHGATIIPIVIVNPYRLEASTAQEVKITLIVIMAVMI
jgi:hypothetical protein